MSESFLVTVARKVRDNGKTFEDILRDKERENHKFAFLRDDKVRRASFRFGGGG